jgi:hypothetical protein
MIKIYFQDLSELKQMEVREEVRELLLSEKAQDMTDDELFEYENSDDIEEDINHYINTNNRGVEYNILEG